MMGRLHGKGALVTGASRGIGAAIAKRLASDGARVIVNYRVAAAEANQTVVDIRAAGGWAEAIQTDVADVKQIQSLVEESAARLASTGGRLDLLVNNAGIADFGEIDQLNEAQFDRQFATNVKSVLFGSQAAAHVFGDKGGSITNISSINGQMPAPTYAIYSATKAAVEAITVALSAELGPRGIRVNAVAPGTTATDMTRRVLTPKLAERAISRTALRRIGTPDDIAKVVAFLASDEAAWITGEIIAANGGLR